MNFEGSSGSYEEQEERSVSENNNAHLLEIKGVYKSFGKNAVLKGINMTLDRGEILALIGGNGAGKSTLGVVLAKVLGYEFLDSDLLIQRQGKGGEEGHRGLLLRLV